MSSAERMGTWFDGLTRCASAQGGDASYGRSERGTSVRLDDRLRNCDGLASVGTVLFWEARRARFGAFCGSRRDEGATASAAANTSQPWVLGGMLNRRTSQRSVLEGQRTCFGGGCDFPEARCSSLSGEWLKASMEGTTHLLRWGPRTSATNDTITLGWMRSSTRQRAVTNAICGRARLLRRTRPSRRVDSSDVLDARWRGVRPAPDVRPARKT
jgi:hypothetical protein